jgi:hypothetical protein
LPRSTNWLRGAELGADRQGNPKVETMTQNGDE